MRQIRGLEAAYHSLNPSKPWLPPLESPLPALLALRNTDSCIKETQDAVVLATKKLKTITLRLEREKADVSDARLIQNALDIRSASLRHDIQQQTQKTPGQITRGLVSEIMRSKASFDGETGRLVKAFNAFIDDHLAVMLAAEELGGPIVGDQLDDHHDAQGGELSRGAYARNRRATMSKDKRQRRIDEVWSVSNRNREEPDNEERDAAIEMRELTEQLLNSSVEAKGHGAGAYVDLLRESAAARFLVRSKVAQFHPKDSRRLRLLDFGGELGD